jgi:hypothetical protein
MTFELVRLPKRDFIKVFNPHKRGLNTIKPPYRGGEAVTKVILGTASHF